MPLYMTYETAKEVLFKLEERLRATKDRFLDFPKNQHGFTTDKARFSHDYRAATRDYDNATRALETFVNEFEKEFREQIRAEKLKGKAKAAAH